MVNESGSKSLFFPIKYLNKLLYDMFPDSEIAQKFQ